MHYNLKESGERIQKLRKQRGLTQQELADQVGITVSNLSKLERGIQGLSIDLLIELAVFFDTSMDYIALGHETQADTVKTMLRTMADTLIEFERKL